MLLLVRHLESNKNIMKQFSSVDDDEILTNNGMLIGDEVAQDIDFFVNNSGFCVDKIYCANSIRAKETAHVIASKLGVKICAYKELCSNNSGNLRGKSEIEAEIINPVFMKQLKLFRAGIYSSYDFAKVANRENKRDFEKRVNECLDEIIKNDTGSLRIIVLHHSSLTAAIINIARKLYNYPENYYGHVACELGHLYLISKDEIVLCNEPSGALREVRIV